MPRCVAVCLIDLCSYKGFLLIEHMHALRLSIQGQGWYFVCVIIKGFYIQSLRPRFVVFDCLKYVIIKGLHLHSAPSRSLSKAKVCKSLFHSSFLFFNLKVYTYRAQGQEL